jgi:predicted nucleotidyltransferase
MDLRDLLDCEVDVVTEAGVRTRIRRRVFEEAKPL